jgi:CBS domain-containing protein
VRNAGKEHNVAKTIQDVMTTDPITLQASDTVRDAAQAMREADVGDVIVLQGDKVCGILTDRDIVVRAVADGRDPASVKVADVCSPELTCVSAGDSVDDAIRIMRDMSIRRLPVVDGGRAVGIVTIGDLAVDRDPGSALADISAAPPNT